MHNASAYRDTGEELLNDAYLSPKFINSLKGDESLIEEWKSRIKGDSGVYGLLAGRDFAYGQVVLWFPSECNEAVVVGEDWLPFFAQRDVSRGEEYLKNRFHPCSRTQKCSASRLDSRVAMS